VGSKEGALTALTQLIRHDPPLSTGATAVYPNKPALVRKYRFPSRFGDMVLLHQVEGDHIHLPRALCPVATDDQRDDGQKVVFHRCPEPWPDQTSWFGETVAFLREGRSGVVVAGTGRGKTVCGYFAAYHLRRKTLVVTTKDDIYKQWIEGARAFLGLAEHEIGEIRQDKCQVVGTSFVVAMIHSLSRAGKYPSWIGEGFGLVIFDECHRVPAEHFSVVASMFKAKLRLGLSATPERADGKELLVQAHIGPVRARADAQLVVPKVLRYSSGWQCPRRYVQMEDGTRVIERLPHEAGQTTWIEKIMAADPTRNHFIGELVAAAYHRHRKLVLFSTLHAHLESLHRVLHGLGIPGKDMGYYIGASTKAERSARDRAKIKPIILTTYGMMGEGTDIPWLDCCVLAIPRSRVEQPVGRIRREYPDKLGTVVIDVVDTDSPVFAGYAAERMKWYRRIGAEIKDMN
jgi:superfamily II DNA or RNA helicase